MTDPFVALLVSVPLCPLYSGPDPHTQRVDEVLYG